MPEVDENGLPNSRNSFYAHDLHLVGDVRGGLRICSKNKKIAINIFPFNFRVGYPDFMQVNMKLELDITL